MTGAKVVTLLGCGSDGEVQSLAVHPGTWKARLEAPATQQLLELAVRTAQVSYWRMDADGTVDRTHLKSLKVLNGLSVPLLDGTTQIGALLALGVDPVEDVEVPDQGHAHPVEGAGAADAEHTAPAGSRCVPAAGTDSPLRREATVSRGPFSTQ